LIRYSRETIEHCQTSTRMICVNSRKRVGGKRQQCIKTADGYEIEVPAYDFNQATLRSAINHQSNMIFLQISLSKRNMHPPWEDAINHFVNSTNNIPAREISPTSHVPPAAHILSSTSTITAPPSEGPPIHTPSRGDKDAAVSRAWKRPECIPDTLARLDPKYLLWKTACMMHHASRILRH